MDQSWIEISSLKPMTTQEPTYPKNRITGVILAGGRARRMGGRDKGLMRFAHRHLAEHAAGVLAPQVGALLVNANRNGRIYRELGYTVVPDAVGGYPGPLAGMASGMQAASTPYVVTVPCDAPFAPPDLVARLYGAMAADRAEIGVVHDGERAQPVFALLRSSLAQSILDFLAGGDRKVMLWYARHRVAWVDFSHRPGAFLNVNTPKEKGVLEGTVLEKGQH